MAEDKQFDIRDYTRATLRMDARIEYRSPRPDCRG